MSARPTLITQRKSWDLKSARSCSNLPSPVKPSAGSVSNGRCSVADSDSDKEVAGSYVESLERKLRNQEAECRALARERCQLSAQLQDSVEYIGDLERELLRLQESEQGAATGADDNYVVDEEEKHPMELREEAQYNDILCSELAEENDQLREQINQLMRELQSLVTQRDSPEMAAVATADVAAQTLCSLKDEETQANDNSAEAAAAVAAATAAAKVTSLKLRLSELEQERQIMQKRVENLTLQIAESTDRYKQLQVAHQSSLAAGNLARDEADSLRQQLAALQAAEAAETQQAVDKALSEVQHRCKQELQSQTAQLLSRLAGLESQLTACRELLRWSGANSDRDWQRVKAELCLLRQTSEAAASSDELLRQLADREERLLEMEARLQSLSPPQQLPKKPMESPQQQRRRQQRRHFLSLGGRRRKQTKEDTSGKSDKEDCDVTRADDCGFSSSSSDQTGAILAERVKSTLAMMEARICEAQATARLTGALKVDCDSWKRRCRALEATIASSADWSSPREFMLAPPSLSAGLTASESPMEASTVLKLVQSRDAPDEPTMTSPRASLTSLTAMMSRSLAAVDRCRSVSSGDTRGDLRLGHQQQQQQKQQPQKQQALHQKLATAGTARRCLSSLGLNRRRGGAGSGSNEDS